MSKGTATSSNEPAFKNKRELVSFDPSEVSNKDNPGSASHNGCNSPSHNSFNIERRA